MSFLKGILGVFGPRDDGSRGHNPTDRDRELSQQTGVPSISQEERKALLTPLVDCRDELSAKLRTAEQSVSKLFDPEKGLLSLSKAYLSFQLNIRAIKDDQLEYAHPDVEEPLNRLRERVRAACESEPQAIFDRSWKNARRDVADRMQGEIARLLNVEIVGVIKPVQASFKDLQRSLREVSATVPTFERVAKDVVTGISSCEPTFDKVNEILVDLKHFRPRLSPNLEDLVKRSAEIEAILSSAAPVLRRVLQNASSIKCDLYEREVEVEFIKRCEQAMTSRPLAAEQAKASPGAAPGGSLDLSHLSSGSVDAQSLLEGSATLPVRASTDDDIGTRVELLQTLGVPAESSSRLAAKLGADEILAFPGLAEAKGVRGEHLRLVLTSNAEILTSTARFTREIVNAREVFDKAYRSGLDPAQFSNYEDLRQAVDRILEHPTGTKGSIEPELSASPEMKLWRSVAMALGSSGAISRQTESHAEEILEVAASIVCFGFAFKGQLHCNERGINSEHVLANAVGAVEESSAQYVINQRFSEALRRLVREGVVGTKLNAGYHLVKDPSALSNPDLRQANAEVVAFYKALGLKIL